MAKQEPQEADEIHEATVEKEQPKGDVDKIRAERDRLSEKLREISRDPEVARRAEELHRRVSRLDPEDLLRPFTI